jgi:CRISPR-associated endonuclease/helicase Cas3
MIGWPKSGEFWGKFAASQEGQPPQWHPLRFHCADVSACFEALLNLELPRRRLAATANLEELDGPTLSRLAVLAALHDVGKFNHGFQRKIQPASPPAGHVGEALALLLQAPLRERLLEALGTDILGWTCEKEQLLQLLWASICHHGNPLDDAAPGAERHWKPVSGVDPFDGIRDLGARVRAWFPAAFEPGARPLPATPAFQHAFSGQRLQCAIVRLPLRRTRARVLMKLELVIGE